MIPLPVSEAAWRAGAVFFIENGNVKVMATPLDPELLALLRAHREAIARFMAEPSEYATQ